MSFGNTKLDNVAGEILAGVKQKATSELAPKLKQAEEKFNSRWPQYKSDFKAALGKYKQESEDKTYYKLKKGLFAISNALLKATNIDPTADDKPSPYSSKAYADVQALLDKSAALTEEFSKELSSIRGALAREGKSSALLPLLDQYLAQVEGWVAEKSRQDEEVGRIKNSKVNKAQREMTQLVEGAIDKKSQELCNGLKNEEKEYGKLLAAEREARSKYESAESDLKDKEPKTFAEYQEQEKHQVDHYSAKISAHDLSDGARMVYECAQKSLDETKGEVKKQEESKKKFLAETQLSPNEKQRCETLFAITQRKDASCHMDTVRLLMAQKDYDSFIDGVCVSLKQTYLSSASESLPTHFASPLKTGDSEGTGSSTASGSTAEQPTDERKAQPRLT